MNSVATSHFLSGLKAVSVRELLVGVALGLLFFALPTLGAEETGKTFKVGVLHPGPEVPQWVRFGDEIARDLGYVEGRNLLTKHTWAGGAKSSFIAMRPSWSS